jgi:hypothetical protein
MSAADVSRPIFGEEATHGTDHDAADDRILCHLTTT